MEGLSRNAEYIGPKTEIYKLGLGGLFPEIVGGPPFVQLRGSLVLLLSCALTPFFGQSDHLEACSATTNTRTMRTVGI